MIVAVPGEIAPGERRVALVPESIKKLVKAGVSVRVQSGAGQASFIPDAEFKEAGAELVADALALYASGDFVVKVQPPGTSGGRHEADMICEGAMLLGSLYPTRNAEIMQKLAARRVTAFSTDCIPRTTRAQAMDTLSSMANIAGYKGVLLAADALPRYFPMFMTAAGTTFAAKVFVIGAGVAGLQAIATAKRLGAQVTATDVRPEVKEQIQSVGAKYIGIELKQSASAGGGYAGELSEEDKKRQRELLVEHCATVDVVITTALIGGVFAPKLISAEMVRSMRPGTVIVDLAAEGGGNCELSKPGQTVVESGVTILAPLNLPSSMSNHASVLFSRNLTNFILAFWKDGKFNLDLNDEILKGAVITHNGEIVHAKTKEAAGKRG
ncbi:MAG: Re/Si-specific NAD(P)(+) transhydrogenase subunit alpha [Phycisphaerae bacterium]|nr:MAG: Re/Si-specific NAD(P)(+) transhydrogenase subunit alpha [Planctomycetota bacterium]KAB2950277.1 MAG: Re/Si-specific NAD(P)(+) transhydrogenase subunit alpha [Phycisphaerae bacterium]MBE7456112.1 Re/Si-specific NAD(P)(+) transhydrogenase subunit alpha [Planctomycetia bacterium]MCK6465400.1 Re/Si-specific NAD(P)(+) transhydrogenase subunit alpha [Phycisphaerae bacterium]MCL4718583.1 Re/Si-specific NAD(P)(+) transhydrogenase subunit alpha [Phycisphaerae bacterium]